MDAPLAQPPPILVLNVVFGKQHAVPKWCKKIVARACVMTATVCFKRKINICIAKFGNLGASGVKGSKFLVENVIFGTADPDLPMQLISWGYTMTIKIKGSLLLSAPIVKHFQAKKVQRWAKI